MITYVNSVFVSNANAGTISTDPATIKKGQFIFMDCTEGVSTGQNSTTYVNSLTNVKKFKIGMGTGKTVKDHKGNDHKEIKWSNIIVKDDIKSISHLVYPGTDTEDTVYISFEGLDNNVLNELKEGGKRIIVRLTFKDLPTRFRNWTESYEYVTVEGDTKASIVNGIVSLINKQWKRARVEATAVKATTTNNNAVYGTAAADGSDANCIKLVAMKYDDDNSVDSLSWANKVRFNANIYWTDPAAEGWESLNKHFPKGVSIDKEPGVTYAASAKLVRDREAQAMGYMGILNRGEGTWPIIKPEMNTDIDNGQYDAITIEFENMYRAADDIFRKTKQTVELYVANGTSTNLWNAINGADSDRAIKDTNTEKGNIQ